jgi:hypothetical protein
MILGMIRTAILITFLLSGTAAAQTPKYCANYYDGGRACGIPSLDMCTQSIRGVGGDCEIDNSDEIPDNLMQRLRAARDDRPPAVRDLEPMPPPPQR